MATIIGTNRTTADDDVQPLDSRITTVAQRLAQLGNPTPPLLIAGRRVTDLVAAAAWMAQHDADGMIVPSDRLVGSIPETLLERGYSIVDLDALTVTPYTHRVAAQPGRICLLTSGTTGTPKVIPHTWTTLFTTARVRDPKPQNWLVTYQPGTYAWYQVITLGLFVARQALTWSADRTPARLLDAAARHGVTAISATPTFWRMALLQCAPSQLCALAPRQITLGGERVDQAILDRLRQLFPDATLTHIYASSEAGACIVVRDGREGFPAAWLSGGDAPAGDRPRLQIRDGRLWIHSPHAAVDQAGWINSGDAVERQGDRVIILGREDSSIINVGGQKVAAYDVERRLLEHPSVLWCRVRGRKAPITGHLVTADLVFRSPEDAVPDRALVEFCAQRLPEYMVPRVWTVLAAIPATDNLKTAVG